MCTFANLEEFQSSEGLDPWDYKQSKIESNFFNLSLTFHIGSDLRSENREHFCIFPMETKLMDLAIIVTKDMSARKCNCIEWYMVIRAPRAQRTFFGQSCSFGWSSRFYVAHSTKTIKRYSEHFFPVYILNTALNILKKNWHWSPLTSSFRATNRTALCHDSKFESFTKVPSARTFRQVEKTRFSKYMYIDDLLSNVFD